MIPTKNPKDILRLIPLIVIAMFVNPILGLILIAIFIAYIKKNPKSLPTDYQGLLTALRDNFAKKTGNINIPTTEKNEQLITEEAILALPITPSPFSGQTKLVKNKNYLQVALNSTLEEAKEIISQLPVSDRILIEAGTPLIKIYGADAISQIRNMAPAGAYIVADNKCADLGAREVEIMANAGANAATCLGVAPIETIDSFIEECQKFNIDSMLDMMNVENALAVLKKLKKLPNVVILHRGVDESEFSKEKQIPYYQIKQIKGNYNILVSVAGGDTIREVQRAIFNDANIVVVWKNFYKPGIETAQLADSFLKEIK